MTVLLPDEADLAVLGVFSRRLEEAPADPRATWHRIARPDQRLPEGDYRVFLLTGGRGSGKTFSGSNGLAELILADTDSGGQWGICAPTYRDAWTVCVESESGILRALGTSAGEIKHGTSRTVEYAHRSYGEIGLHNGHVIYVDSADDGALRVQGKNLRGIWCLPGYVNVTTHGGILPIRDVRCGDLVLTRNGYRRVTASRLTGRGREIVRVRAEDGTELDCTPDHRIWAEGRGWTQAQDLRPGDLLCLARQPGTTSRDAGSTGWQPGTTAPATGSGPPGSTWPYGNASTAGASHPGMSSTMMTSTRRTTTLATSYSSRMPSMTGTTRQGSSDHRQPWRGCEPGSSTHGRTGNPGRSPASDADSLSPPGARETPLTARSYAGNGATSNIALVPLGGIARGGPARTAVRDSSRRTAGPAIALQSVPVATVSKLSRREDVYDLTVEGAHEFFAGGILVHNCDEIGLWQKWQTAWDESIKYAVRKGSSKIIATGTPKVSRPARALIRRLLRGEEPGVIVRRLRTIDNAANLSEAFYASVIGAAKGTRLERQELEGELLDDVENALWTRDLLERIQVPAFGTLGGPQYLWQAKVGVDPSDGTEDSDEQAYTVIGKGGPDDPHLYVAENWGGQEPPARFARRCILVAVRYNAELVVEKNHGGEWLRETFAQVMKDLLKEGKIPDGRCPRVRLVHASQAKRTRAEPVSAMYERDVVRHCKMASRDHHGNLDVRPMVELEDQMVTFTGAAGERSPDRLDSLTWGATPFLNTSFGPPGQAGKREWAGTEGLGDIGVSGEARAHRRMREIQEKAAAGVTAAGIDATLWDLDGFAPSDDREAARPRHNVRSWR